MPCARRGRRASRSRCASPPTTGSAPTGMTPEDAVAIARLLKEAGVDIIDVSAGQTSQAARPVYGRMFQTPFSDRIRNEVGIATMAVGNIYEPDHVNSILMAGRADLCCLARPHLADPYWTLHAAARLGYARRDLAQALSGRPRPAASAGGPRRAGDGARVMGAARRQACPHHRRRQRHRRGDCRARSRGAGAAVSLAGRRAGPLEEVAARLAARQGHRRRRDERGRHRSPWWRRRGRRTGPSTSSSPMPGPRKARRPPRSTSPTGSA